MFGSSIETTVKREKLHGGRNIPKIISQCIGYLDNSFRLKENGIFRLPGNEKTVSLFLVFILLFIYSSVIILLSIYSSVSSVVYIQYTGI